LTSEELKTYALTLSDKAGIASLEAFEILVESGDEDKAVLVYRERCKCNFRNGIDQEPG
jgi:hypothetical protein